MIKILQTIVLLLGIILGAYAQQPLLQYSNTYAYLGSGTEQGVSIAYDDLGNAYVTGITDTNGNNDIITIKYSPIGTKLWEKIYSGLGNGDDRPVKVITTGSEVYITGYSRGINTGYDWVTIAYDAYTGYQDWIKIYNDTYNGDDKATDIKVDRGGNVYVSGTSTNAYSKTDAYLIKYNSVTGGQIRTYYKSDGSSYNLTPYDIAINTSNTIFFSTSRYNYNYSYEGRTDIYVLDTSLSNSGTTYSVQYISSLKKIIPNGNYYYVIAGGGPGTSLTKVPVGNYNATWLTGRFGAVYPTYTNIYDYDIDDYGNPYVLWYDTIDGGTQVNTFKWAKLNPATGDTIFTRTFDPTNQTDRPLQIKVGHQGIPIVYITGNTIKDGKLQNYTVGYNSTTGAALWTLNQACTNIGNKSIIDMKIDNFNNIYMTGTTTCSSTYDALTVKYCGSFPIANAGIDKSVCFGSGVQIGATAVAGYTYSWSPTTGLSSPTVSDPVASPTSNTTYILTATSPSGCYAYDTVNVTVLNNCPSCYAPTGLSANTTQTTAIVSWNSVTSAISYTLQYKATASSTWSSPITTTNTSYTISSLVCSTPFEWRVQTNCSGNSSNFTSSTFTTNACSGGLPNLGKSIDNISIASNSFTISATVQNYGGSTASACSIGYYISTDPTFNTGRILVGSSTLPAIAAGNSFSVSSTINLCNLGLNNDIPYYIGYYIDNTFIVSETTESDNGYWFWSSPTITLHCNLVPANDQCSGVITLTCGSDVTGSTTYAGSVNDPVSTCGTTSGAPGVWYKIVGNGKIITASLCGSSYDTKIQIYSGSCNNLTCITGNDDSCGTQSIASWLSSNNITYYIFVYGYSEDVGDFQLNISCATATAIKNNSSVIDKINLYPNPASQNLNVSILSNKNAKIQFHIFDIGGKEIYNIDADVTRGENNKTIDISRFPKGMYLLQLNNEEDILIEKFIVE